MSDKPTFLHTYYWRFFSQMLREELCGREITLEKARTFIPLSPEGAKRYINNALSEGLIVRGKSGGDKRKTVYELSPRLRKDIEQILDKVLIAVEPIFHRPKRPGERLAAPARKALPRPTAGMSLDNARQAC